MTDDVLLSAFEATWPAAEYADCGGFRVGRGMGAGGRVSSAGVIGAWTGDDIDAVVARHRAWNQRPLFRVLDADTALADALLARGFRRASPTAIMDAPVSALTDREIPPVTAFPIWPPLAIERHIWERGSIGPQRQAVMQRVSLPKISVLGRIEDRAAGAAFAAILGPVAMIHAIEVEPALRRKGVAGWMIRQIAFWAAANAASRVGLAVGRENEGAVTLYRRLGFADAGGYAYFTQE